MRIKRCLIAYTHERLVRVETLRWEYGAVLPARWSSRLSRKEEDYSKAYGDALAEYMRSVDLDVTADVQPPRQLHVMVRVRRAIGEVVLASGQAVNMQPGTTLLLRRSDAEALVRRGALEEVDADA
ncbi:gins1 [Symbiodinium sp. KB8]|nr:gins1 [Symbiodinium sp. KB8]